MERRVEAEQISAALSRLGAADPGKVATAKLAAYSNLLLKWNARTNLISARASASFLEDHLIDCILAAAAVPEGARTLLDYGSGAGLPGLIIAACRPLMNVTLAESQARKAAFLREAVRSIEIEAEVFHGRVDEMRGGRLFDCVTLRAVDKMEKAVMEARSRVAPDGSLLLFVSENSEPPLLPILAKMTLRRVPLARGHLLIAGT